MQIHVSTNHLRAFSIYVMIINFSGFLKRSNGDCDEQRGRFREVVWL